MKEEALNQIRDLWKKQPMRTSLMTSLTLIGGEALLYLDTCGEATLQHLAKTLEWPIELVYVAVGALVQQGVVTLSHTEDDIWVRPAPKLVAAE